MSITREFERYQHVEQVMTQARDGLMPSRASYYVSEKLDGANAGILRTTTGLLLHSRRVPLAHLSPDPSEVVIDSGLNGFVAYVAAKQDELMSLMLPGRHIYGEWLTPHTLTYPATMYRKFYAYPGQHLDAAWPFERAYLDRTLEGVSFAEDYGDSVGLHAMLQQTADSMAAKLGRPIEGVIFAETHTLTAYKFVLPKFKEEFYARRDKVAKDGMTEVEQRLANSYSARQYIKMREKATDLKGPLDRRHVAMMLGLCWHDFVSENLATALRKAGYPVINSRSLLKHVQERARDMFLAELDTGTLPNWATNGRDPNEPALDKAA